jgi:hypothetical protein
MPPQTSARNIAQNSVVHRTLSTSSEGRATIKVNALRLSRVLGRALVEQDAAALVAAVVFTVWSSTACSSKHHSPTAPPDAGAGDDGGATLADGSAGSTPDDSVTYGADAGVPEAQARVAAAAPADRTQRQAAKRSGRCAAALLIAAPACVTQAV